MMHFHCVLYVNKTKTFYILKKKIIKNYEKKNYNQKQIIFL